MFEGILSNVGSAAAPFVAAAFTAFIVGCLVHFALWGQFQRARAFIHYAFWLFFLSMIMLIILPLPDIMPGFCSIHQDAGEPELAPLSFAGDIARHSGFTRQRFSLQRLLSAASFQLAVSNVVLFIPLGVYLVAMLRRNFWQAVLISFCCTLALEVTQGTALFGLYPCPYRHFNVDDLMLNTLGSVLGIFAVRIWNSRGNPSTRPYRS
jgi:glycopeptide antibiotics resistance protein